LVIDTRGGVGGAGMTAEMASERPAAGWKGGRPRLPDERRRRVALPAVRMTEAELAAAAAVAVSCGLSLSELVRRRLAGRRLPRAVPAVNRDAWSRLGPLAANLNQYARHSSGPGGRGAAVAARRAAARGGGAARGAGGRVGQ
jgi:hypothetical protein